MAYRSGRLLAHAVDPYTECHAPAPPLSMAARVGNCQEDLIERAFCVIRLQTEQSAPGLPSDKLH